MNTLKLPTIILDAQKRQDNDYNWIWFQSSVNEQNTVDKYLIEIKHPSVYEPGTKHNRFIAYINELNNK